ncbi:MAG: DUF2341 domain-containing protein, partial [Patescibacteria group bacterium]
DGTTKLAHEIEKYASSTGEVVAWVKIPTLSTSTNTDVYMYYGSATTTVQASSTGVWNANYVGVWHLNEDNSSMTIYDSTANAMNGTKVSATDPAAVSTGTIAGAHWWDGSSDTITIPYQNIGSASLSYTLWARRSGSGNEQPLSFMNTLVRIAGSAILYWPNTGVAQFESLYTWTNNVWKHLAITQSGTNCVIYVDGNTLSSTTSCPAIDTTNYSSNKIGSNIYSQQWTGGLDEVHIASTTMTAGWIRTEYNNQSSPSTFYSTSTEEAIATFTQSAYRWFYNVNATSVGAAYAAQDTSTTLASASSTFRLHMTLHVSTTAASPGADIFKLQYSSSTAGGCDAAYSGETYTDVATSTGEIRYHNNSLAPTSSLFTATSGEPGHSTHTTTTQTYEERNTWTVTSSIASGADGIWDFSLVDAAAPPGTTYCFRAVKSDGTLINTSSDTKIPEIKTFIASTFTESAYAWFENVNATSVGALLTTSSPSGGFQNNWYSNWPYRQKFTIDNTKVSGTINLSDFPVLIAATSTPWKFSGYAGGHVGIASGTDILFTSSDGTTKLAHEIEKYASSTG